MKHKSKIDTLLRSGFAFFANIGDSKIVMENKFTGLRITYDEQTGKWDVIMEESK